MVNIDRLKCIIYVIVSLIGVILGTVSATKREYCFQVCKPKQIFDEDCCYKYGMCCSGTRREDPNYWSEVNAPPMDEELIDSDFEPIDKSNRRFNSNRLSLDRGRYEDVGRREVGIVGRQPRVFHKNAQQHTVDDGIVEPLFKPYEY